MEIYMKADIFPYKIILPTSLKSCMNFVTFRDNRNIVCNFASRSEICELLDIISTE